MTATREGSAAGSKDSNGRLATVGRKRTRTGCLNCRRKRRKCDETKPTCAGCRARREICKWGIRVSFRPEHAQTMDQEHPSMQLAASAPRGQTFHIVDVTAEVIRDYFEESPEETVTTEHGKLTAPTRRPDGRASALDMLDISSVAYPSPLAPTPATGNVSMQSTSSVATGQFFLSPQLSDSAFEDGIFLPGSEYQELHAALRSRIIDTARSTMPSRITSPELSEPAPVTEDKDDDESRRLAQLTPEQEYVLWQNYISEVAGWMDKFDIERHFELVLPVLAQSHSHLKYSLLALSARQIERKQQTTDNSCSLALYSYAIHLLSPLLQQRTTVVLASCVVLGVLEMLSCSPKAWRRHLDGCAALIQALCISGSCGTPLERALFWTFARMDIAGSLISSEKTLIPMHKWVSGGDLAADTAILRAVGTLDMCAHHVVYLCGRVVELLCAWGKWEQRHCPRSSLMDVMDYAQQWSALYETIEDWYDTRPEELRPLLTIPIRANATHPFPTILFGNGPGTSGNQMYHTAALLMLKYGPAHVHHSRKTHSMLWHARNICAISISNDHHGCWTNSTQPLWIAGQHMGHPSEHRAILEIYKRIERETGWSTKWRADDLREFWGEAE